MKTVATMGAQGDCLFRKIARMPAGATERELSGSQVVLAHSETGHHHAIDDTTGIRLFDAPGEPLICYLRVEGVEHVDVVHHRPFDTHQTIRLLATPGEAAIFEVRRQREYVEPSPRDTRTPSARDTRTWVPVRD